MYNSEDNEKYNDLGDEFLDTPENTGYELSDDEEYQTDDFDQYSDDESFDYSGINEEGVDYNTEMNDENYADDSVDIPEAAQKPQSPYLNKAQKNGGAKPKKSSVPLLLCLVLLLAALIGVTYFKTGTFDVSKLFSSGNDAVAENKDDSIEDAAISKQGDDLFAEAVKAGAEENKEPSGDSAAPKASAGAEEQPVAAGDKSTVKLVPIDGTSGNKNVKIIPVRRTMSGRREPFYPVGYKKTLSSKNVAYELERELSALLDEREQRNQEIVSLNRSYSEPAIVPAYQEAAAKEIERITRVTVNGIMFDAKKPSAIIRLDDNNIDYLVHKGDKFDGFTVKDIGRKTVVVQRGSNTYTATLGQSSKIEIQDTYAAKTKYDTVKEYAGDNYVPLAIRKTEGLNFNPVNNIDKKFGGANGHQASRAIMINGK